MFSWQPIAAGTALLLALVYISRRIWLRLSSLRPSKRLTISCGGQACCGCGPTRALPQKPSRPNVDLQPRSGNLNLAGPFKARLGTDNQNRVALATHENRVFRRR
jgi:hypothetical protein